MVVDILISLQDILVLLVHIHSDQVISKRLNKAWCLLCIDFLIIALRRL